MQKNFQQQKTRIGERPYFYKVIHAEKVLIRGPILLSENSHDRISLYKELRIDKESPNGKVASEWIPPSQHYSKVSLNKDANGKVWWKGFQKV